MNCSAALLLAMLKKYHRFKIDLEPGFLATPPSSIFFVSSAVKVDGHIRLSTLTALGERLSVVLAQFTAATGPVENWTNDLNTALYGLSIQFFLLKRASKRSTLILADLQENGTQMVQIETGSFLACSILC